MGGQQQLDVKKTFRNSQLSNNSMGQMVLSSTGKTVAQANPLSSTKSIMNVSSKGTLTY